MGGRCGTLGIQVFMYPSVQVLPVAIPTLPTMRPSTLTHSPQARDVTKNPFCMWARAPQYFLRCDLAT